MFRSGTLLNKRYKVLRQIDDGGFSLIFEVKDIRQSNLKNSFGLRPSQSIKILKALNYSGYQQQDAEFLFRREISLLRRLNHPQIAKYIDDFDYIEGHRLIPCLVLEKVPGKTLEAWLQQHGPISEELALDWLYQCANVLDYLHDEQRIIHLDIKPSNLILKPSTELVFIDFGIARLISQTLFADLLDEEGRKVGTDWYMAPEQRQGKPVAQSDIYALGRLIIQALANCSEEQIPQDDEGEWLWDDIAPTLSPETRALLGGMTNRYVRDRLSNIQEIEHTVERVQNKYFTEEVTLTSRFRNLLRWNVLPSAIITGLIMLLRVIGLLEPFELFTYDFMIRMRPDVDGPDPRISIINITGKRIGNTINDIEYQQIIDPEMPSSEISISDRNLNLLLNKIQTFSPSVIGIDVRKRSVNSSLQNTNIIGMCASGHQGNVRYQRSPTIGVSNSRLGFTDIDRDHWFKTVRRHIVIRSESEECPTHWSFAYRVAHLYAVRNNISASDLEPFPSLNKNSYPRIFSHHFFYSRFNHNGYQILINYRAYEDAANVYSLKEILEEEDEDRLREILGNKIVLIGSDAFEDILLTPYGEKSGVIVQAHKVSGLLDSALNQRRTPIYFSWKGNILWIFSFGSVYGLLSRHTKTIGNHARIFLFFAFGFICFSFFLVVYSYYFPVVPVLMSWLIFSGFIVRLKKSRLSKGRVGYVRVEEKNNFS